MNYTNFLLKLKRGIPTGIPLFLWFEVRMKGLEPPRPETLDPKSNAATNYATCAGLRAKVGIFSEIAKFFLFGGDGAD